MSTFTKFAYHIIFSTKYRHALIREPYRTELYNYIGGIIRSQKGNLIEIGGVEDHIHILANLPATITISDAIREIKANSSRWFNENGDKTHKFEWQKGYGGFSVSYSQIGAVQNYIRNQEEHHKHKSFKDEFVEFLKLNNIAYDSKYIFEDEIVG